VASDPGDRDIGVRGFQQQRKFASRIRDPRNPEVTWQVGPRPLVEYRWKHIGVRGSGIHRVSEPRHFSRRFPDREIPDK
jgi:hypothetical protein